MFLGGRDVFNARGNSTTYICQKSEGFFDHSFPFLLPLKVFGGVRQKWINWEVNDKLIPYTSLQTETQVQSLIDNPASCLWRRFGGHKCQDNQTGREIEGEEFVDKKKKKALS